MPYAGMLKRSSPLSALPPIAILYVLFFASGFSALIYQTAWHRMLGLFGGADSISAALVVGAFLLGLGLGSLLAGLWVDRLTHRQSLFGFALCELAIALFAILSPTLFYDLVFGQLLPLSDSRLVVFAVIFIGLLWPTMLMGFSLPLLSKAIVVDIAASARQIGWLYGVNTLGAGIGAFTSGWLIIGHIGYDGAVYVAAAINLAVGLGGLALCLGAAPAAQPAKLLVSELRVAADPPVAATSLFSWCLLVFISGFLIVALQIVWYRLIGVALQSNAYAFSLVLSVFLLGDGLGLFVGARIVDRIADPRRFFLAMQAVATCLAVGVVFVAYKLFGLTGWAPIFVERDIVTGRPADIAAIIALSALVILPGSFIFGFSFPVVQKAVQRDLNALGRRVGLVQLANILGNSAGSLAAGLVALHWWGTGGTMQVIALGGLGFAVAWVARVWRGEGSRFGAASAAISLAALAAIFALFPSNAAFWMRLHRVEPGQRAFVAEDRTGLALLRIDRADRGRLFINGHSQSHLPFSTGHVFLGAVGPLIHPRPEQVLVIGIGGGGTPYSAGINPKTVQVTAVEIVQPAMETLRQFVAQGGKSGVDRFLADRRFSTVIADGRHFLAVRSQKYDVIEADAILPKSSLSGLLYSAEFFSQVRARLKPGGIYVQWAPTWRVMSTLRTVFPHVTSIRVTPFVRVLLATEKPLTIDTNTVIGLLRDAAVREYLTAARIDVSEIEEVFATQKPEVLNAGQTMTSGDINRDLFPRDEYYLNR